MSLPTRTIPPVASQSPSPAVPSTSTPPSTSTATSTAAADTRLDAWKAVVTRVLSLAAPRQCSALLPMVAEIASFVHLPGCFGRVAMSISTCSVVDSAASGRQRQGQGQGAGRLGLAVSTFSHWPCRPSTQQCTAVHEVDGGGRGGSSMSCAGISAATGDVYVRCGGTKHVVVRPDGGLVQLPSLFSAPPVEAEAAGSSKEAASAVFAFPRADVLLYSRLVTSMDRTERILTVDGTGGVHLWSVDGQRLERSFHGLLPPLHLTDRVEAVAVSSRDDSFHVGHSFYDGMRSSGRLTHFDGSGRPVGPYHDLIPRGSGAPHTLHLMPSAYGSSEADWLYAAIECSVTVCDTLTRAMLFRIGCSTPALSGGSSLSCDHSAAFVLSTRAFLHAQQLHAMDEHQQQWPQQKRMLLHADEVDDKPQQRSIDAMACDSHRGELYLHLRDRTSRHWLVCDQRGRLLRWWREQEQHPLLRGELHVDQRGTACFDPTRQRLACCCQRTQTASPDRAGMRSSSNPTHMSSTVITISA